MSEQLVGLARGARQAQPWGGRPTASAPTTGPECGPPRGLPAAPEQGRNSHVGAATLGVGPVQLVPDRAHHPIRSEPRP